MKKEDFRKMEKNFQQKSEHSKQDVAAYNDAVKDLNKSLEVFNASINSVNATRTTMLNNWNETQKTFTDSNMPYFKK